MKKVFGLCLLAGILLGAGTAAAKELLVCIPDMTAEKNIMLPGKVFALPDTLLKCSSSSGAADETYQSSLRELYKKKWRLINVVASPVAEKRIYSVYYLEK